MTSYDESIRNDKSWQWCMDYLFCKSLQQTTSLVTAWALTRFTRNTTSYVRRKPSCYRRAAKHRRYIRAPLTFAGGRRSTADMRPRVVALDQIKLAAPRPVGTAIQAYRSKTRRTPRPARCWCRRGPPRKLRRPRQVLRTAAGCRTRS